METTINKTLEITPDAQRVIGAMRDRLANVRYQFGENSEEYTKMAGSLAFSLAQMLNLGGTITKDGDLSLYCWNGIIAYGVNFHNSQHRDKDFPYNLLGEWSVNS